MFYAIEINEGETPHSLVKLIVETAHLQGRKFASLELMGFLVLGRQRYIRFRVSKPVLEPTLCALERSVILPKDGAYIQLPTQRKVAALLLQSIPDRQVHRKYRGPSVQFWERQFLEKS